MHTYILVAVFTSAHIMLHSSLYFVLISALFISTVILETVTYFCIINQPEKAEWII